MLNYNESDEIGMYRRTVQLFLERECSLEKVELWDKEDRIPRELMVKMAEIGICGLNVPAQYGGMGRQVIAMVAVLEELSKRSQALAALYNMCAGYGALNIYHSGSEAQKRRMLPDFLAGRLLVAYGLSEPDVGADLANVKTRVERRGDKVVLNGQKRWTTGATIADYIYTLARSGPADTPRKNLSFILVPTKAPGVTITTLRTMGSNGVETNDVSLDNVELPFDSVVGEEAGWNQGWSMLAGPGLEIEKLAVPAIALGVTQAAVDEAWEYSQQRIQGGKRICGHQSVRHTLAEVKTRLHACRMVLNHAAWLVDTEQPSAVYTSMAKLFVSEECTNIVLTCQQRVMGAYGYAKGFQMERYLRDILATPIIGGSSAIQRNNIASLLKLPRE